MNSLMEMLRAYFEKTNQKFVLTNEVVKKAIHSRIAPFISSVMDVSSSKEEDVQLLKRECMISIQRDLRQEKEYGNLLQIFEDEGIDCVPLKGYWMKKEYPASNYRFMGDLDVLVHESDFPKVDTILKKLNYVMGKDCEHHLSYEKKPIFEVEIHRVLIGDEHRIFGKKYLDSIWDRVILAENKKHIYKMTNEDFFLHLIFHGLKHYKNAGTGIRTYLDLYIFAQNHSDLNWDYIHEQYKGQELEKELFELEDYARNLFNKNSIEHTYTKEAFDSGLYGTSVNAMKGQLEKKTIISWIFSKWFKPYSYVKEHYPIIGKLPVLLPLFYIYRLIYFVILSPRRLIQKICLAIQAKKKK